jgi:hypothetical protein
LFKAKKVLNNDSSMILSTFVLTYDVAVQGRPRGIYVDLNANTIISSSDHMLQIYDPINFDLIQVIGTEYKPEQFYYPTGLCVDDENSLHVCDC